MTNTNYSHNNLEKQLLALLTVVQNNEIPESFKREIWDRLNGIDLDSEMIKFLFTGWWIYGVIEDLRKEDENNRLVYDWED